jgi:hypothetical protein
VRNGFPSHQPARATGKSSGQSITWWAKHSRTVVVLVLVLSAWVLTGKGAVSGQASVKPVRYEIVIHQRLVDRVARIWIWITVDGGQPIDALLDTGSTGLLVLASALPSVDSLPNKGSVKYTYATGEVLVGRKTKAIVAFDNTGPKFEVPFGMVTALGCTPEKPKCPTSRVKFDQYRIAGDLGFRAILGIGLGTELLPNPLATTGNFRWIIDLANDKLIVNPYDTDLVGFSIYHVAKEALGVTGGFRGAVPGCLVARNSGERVCGPTAIDTGSMYVGILTKDSSLFDRMRNAENFAFEFGVGDDKSSMNFSMNSGRFERLNSEFIGGSFRTAILAGLPPYYEFSVFYDFSKNIIGLKRK